MRTIVYLLALLLAQQSYAQTVPSSCSAPDSIIKRYIIDADLMAQRRMWNTNYQDTIEIPQSWTDTSLRAMIAVYNATTLPARDSVVSLHKLHNSDTDMVRIISVIADSMAGYMKQMKAGNIPTGFTPFDDLMTKYHLHLRIYAAFAPQFPGNHGVILNSDSSYNMDALADSFMVIPGVSSAGASFLYFVDSMGITDTITPNYVALDYRYSWGNCVVGCQYSHTWHFRVAYNCDVTYKGSDGDPFPVGIKNISRESAGIYPNPAHDVLHVPAGPAAAVMYSICNMQGQLMQTGETAGDISIKHLPPGNYFLRLSGKEVNQVMKFLKQ